MINYVDITRWRYTEDQLFKDIKLDAKVEDILSDKFVYGNINDNYDQPFINKYAL